MAGEYPYLGPDSAAELLQLADVTLVCKDGELPALKAFLSRGSKVRVCTLVAALFQNAALCFAAPGLLQGALETKECEASPIAIQRWLHAAIRPYPCQAPATCPCRAAAVTRSNPDSAMASPRPTQVLAALFDSMASSGSAQQEGPAGSEQQEGPSAKRQRSSSGDEPAAPRRQHTRLETPFKEFEIESVTLFLQVIYDASTIDSVAESLYCESCCFDGVCKALQPPVCWLGWVGCAVHAACLIPCMEPGLNSDGSTTRIAQFRGLWRVLQVARLCDQLDARSCLLKLDKALEAQLTGDLDCHVDDQWDWNVELLLAAERWQQQCPNFFGAAVAQFGGSMCCFNTHDDMYSLSIQARLTATADAHVCRGVCLVAVWVLYAPAPLIPRSNLSYIVCLINFANVIAEIADVW
jgi:hypothetical protein